MYECGEQEVGVASGCGYKEVYTVYRFPHTTYPYSFCICSFLQQAASLLFVHFFNVFRSFRKKNAKSRFFTSRGAYVNLLYIAMLYTYSIGNQP